MRAMEGEGRAPKATGPQQPPALEKPRNPRRDDAPTARTQLPSVDLSDELEPIPASVEDVTDGIDIEFDDAAAADRGSVDKLLAMTGENWSIDAQRETLKEA